MLGTAWVNLRQAQEAFQNGHLEEAQRLLGRPGAMEHKGSWELLRQVAQGFVERGERRLQHDDSSTAWSDLLRAEQIGVTDKSAKLRQALVRKELAEIRRMLEAGEPARAAEAVAILRQRSVQQADLNLLEEAAKQWLQGEELAGRGEFALALQALEHVGRLVTECAKVLAPVQKDWELHAKNFTALILKLHEAVDKGPSRDVLPLAEQVLAVAPQHVEARKARRRAWKALEPVTMSHRPRTPVADAPGSPSEREVVGNSGPRFLLWVDGVGGYLVCLGNRVSMGQATPDATVDVPLFADISRTHALLARDSEGYLLEALRPTLINSKPVDKALLRAGDKLTLGRTCQLRFSQPVPVSATAQLDILSGHRLALAVEKVFLMADTLILGPGPQAHVVIPDLKEPAILFRHKDGLAVRYGGNLVVDGQACKERGILGPKSKVTGDDFAFAIEMRDEGLDAKGVRRVPRV